MRSHQYFGNFSVAISLATAQKDDAPILNSAHKTLIGSVLPVTVNHYWKKINKNKKMWEVIQWSGTWLQYSMWKVG